MNKEFDKFIKNKFEGREFEFKDAYWAEAETMFTNAAPKAGLFQKIGGWWSIFGATGLVVAGLGLAVLKPSKTIDNQLSTTETKMINTTLAEDNVISTVNSNNNNTIELTNNASTNHESAKLTKDVTESLSTKSEDAVSQKIRSSQKANISSAIIETNNQNQPSFTTQKQKTATTQKGEDRITTRKINATTSSSNDEKRFNTGSNTVVNQSTDTKKSSVNNTQKGGGTNVVNPNLSNAAAESEIPYKTTKKTTTKPIATINKKDKGQKDIKNVIENIDALSNPIFTVVSQEELESIRKYKIAQQAKARRFLSFGIIGGMGSSTPYGEGTSNTLTYSPLGGIKAGYSLNKKWAGHLSVIAYSRDVNLTAESSNTTYGFGVQQTTTQVLVNRLDYVEIPLYLTRKLNSRQEVILGLSYAHLLTTSGELFNWQSDSHTKRSLVSSTTEKGYMPGLNRHDFSLLIGYQYNLSPRLSIGAHLKYGLQDITQNNYYNNNILDRNLQVRFVAAYDILSRNL